MSFIRALQYKQTRRKITALAFVALLLSGRVAALRMDSQIRDGKAGFANLHTSGKDVQQPIADAGIQERASLEEAGLPMGLVVAPGSGGAVVAGTKSSTLNHGAVVSDEQQHGSPLEEGVQEIEQIMPENFPELRENSPEVPGSYGEGVMPHSKRDVDAVMKKAITNMARNGTSMLGELTCEKLPVVMAGVLRKVMAYVAKVCPAGGACALSSSSRGEIDLLSKAALAITAFANEADEKTCLSATLSTPDVTELVSAIKGMWQRVLQGSGPEAVQSRMELAHETLMKWQQDVADLNNSVLDRKLFLPGNIEDPSHCPMPCSKCTKKHNSWFKADERFSFKCIIGSNANALEPPSDPGLKCSSVKDRSKWRSKLLGDHSTWCEVLDWKNHAYQKARIVAAIKCAAQDVFAPLQSGLTMSNHILSTCLDIEMSKAVTDEAMQEYVGFIRSTDGLVSNGAKAAFSIFVSLGLAESIANLRRGAQGNSRENTNNALVSSGSVSDDGDGSCEPQDTPPIFIASAKILVSFVGGVVGPSARTLAIGFVLAFAAYVVVFIGLFSFLGRSLTTFAVAAGGYLSLGLAFVLASSSSPQAHEPKQFDCAAGEVLGSSCVTGLRYEQSVIKQCNLGGNITVFCRERNWGAMTKSGSCQD